MKQIDLSIVDDVFLDEYVASIAADDIKNRLTVLSLPALELIIGNLEKILKADIATIKSSYLNLLDTLNDADRKKAEKAFEYSIHRAKEKFMQNFQKLNIKSCPLL